MCMHLYTNLCVFIPISSGCQLSKLLLLILPGNVLPVLSENWCWRDIPNDWILIKLSGLLVTYQWPNN